MLVAVASGYERQRRQERVSEALKFQGFQVSNQHTRVWDLSSCRLFFYRQFASPTLVEGFRNTEKRGPRRTCQN